MQAEAAVVSWIDALAREHPPGPGHPAGKEVTWRGGHQFFLQLARFFVLIEMGAERGERGGVGADYGPSRCRCPLQLFMGALKSFNRRKIPRGFPLSKYVNLSRVKYIGHRKKRLQHRASKAFNLRWRYSVLFFLLYVLPHKRSDGSLIENSPP